MLNKIHLIAACGTGMGTLACILKEMGYSVTGSDQNVYPPMSDFLKKNGIKVFEGFDPSNLACNPDLVIIGNAVTRENVEAQAVLESGTEYLSMPQAVNRFIASDKKIILVTGTHGKTTTSSIMAHILYTAGLDPSFMIGGIVKDFNSSFRIGNGEYMVIEGDEYDTAFFDKGPKFMHYDPEITIMTGIEFDHADIFSDVGHIQKIFSLFVGKIKNKSRIIACDDSLYLNQVLEDQKTAFETYGKNGQWRYLSHSREASKTFFKVSGPQGQDFEIQTGLQGRHNIMNALACIAASSRIGVSRSDIIKSFSRFSGVKRRQEIRGVKNNITIMDDFAHHPTAVKETIKAVKPFYSRGRVIALFEPRTNTSMRHFFQKLYPQSFLEADLVCVCEPGVKKNIPESEKFSVPELVSDINKKGVKAYYFKNSRQVIEKLVPMLRPNDLVLVMSNGGFDNIHEKLIESIK